MNVLWPVFETKVEQRTEGRHDEREVMDRKKPSGWRLGGKQSARDIIVMSRRARILNLRHQPASCSGMGAHNRERLYFYQNAQGKCLLRSLSGAIRDAVGRFDVTEREYQYQA